LRQIQKDQLDTWSIWWPSSFSEKPDISPDEKENSMVLTDDLHTLNQMILDKIHEIKR